MSNLDYYNEKLAAIQAIPDSEIRRPGIPVDVYLQEAENLFHWSQEDKKELTDRGLDWGLVEDMQKRCGALREAQSRWITTRFSHEEAERLWTEKSPLAYDLRDELLHTFRFAYRKQPDILGRVDEIAQDTGHADMIQDLNDLSVLGREHPEALEAIKFDMALLEKAAVLADGMSDLLGAASAERADSSGAKKIRDQAYTHLKEAVDEVREFGRFVFWRDETRIKGYASQYLRRSRRKSEAKGESESDTLS
ncbi:MAG: hypothetical protein SVZ03_13655 [Spirochaetota bacterium]|nr:hypothetical protein [Spirochaetota bacterium]